MGNLVSLPYTLWGRGVGKAVQKLNTSYFYWMGYQIHPAAELQVGHTYMDKYMVMISARSALQHFISQQLFRSAPLSLGAAQKAVVALDAAIPAEFNEDGYPNVKDHIGPAAYTVAEAVKEFEHVFTAEFSQYMSFVASPKGIYDIQALVDSAEKLFSLEILPVIPAAAVADIQTAGKCLAFDLPTSCGFHLMRSIESVMRLYYLELSGESEFLENRSWKTYIRKLEDQGADEKVVAVLDQIRDMHRNPITHPEDTLSVDEAIMLVGMAQSAITTMVIAIKNLRKDTDGGEAEEHAA